MDIHNEGLEVKNEAYRPVVHHFDEEQGPHFFEAKAGSGSASK